MLVIFDAHLDYYPNEDSNIKNWNFIEKLLSKKIFDDVLVIGIRDKYQIYDNSSIHTISSSDMKSIAIEDQKIISILQNKYENIYLSIDVDVLDPKYMPGVSYPEENGISLDCLNSYLYFFTEKFNIKYIDLVEYNPMIDKGNSLNNVEKIIKDIISWR